MRAFLAFLALLGLLAVLLVRLEPSESARPVTAAPAAQDAATPVASPGAAAPRGVSVELLGEGPLSLEANGTPAPSTDHLLYRITIRPGVVLGSIPDVLSTVISVESGQVDLIAPDAIVSLQVGAGAPIQRGDAMVCEAGECVNEPADGATLGPGNGAAYQGTTVSVRATGDQPAVIILSAVMSPIRGPHMCWICPKP